MFIVCPKCSAKYKIPEGIQLENGQKLKCSACDFVFLKGEEAPFTLEEPLPNAPQTEPGNTPKTPFSEPLYTAQGVKTSSAADSLPDAFKPVGEPPKKKKGLGLVLLYLILVVALCVAGWIYRDSLKPSLQNSLSLMTLDETKLPPKMRKNTLPVRTQKVQPANQPVVQVTDLDNPKVAEPKKEAIKPKPVPPPKKQDTFEPVKPQKPVKKETLPTSSNKNPEPISDSNIVKNPPKPIEPVMNLEEKPEIVLPLPEPERPKTIDSDLPTPAVVELPTLAEEKEVATVPLFEVIDTPLPAATATELSVNAILFRVAPTEEGIDEVLIEGQIQNNAREKKSIPVLTVLAVNKEGQVLAQKTVHTADDNLNAGEQMPFYTNMTPAPKDLDHIEVKF